VNARGVRAIAVYSRPALLEIKDTINEANHTQYSSPVEALNLRVKISLEVNNSTIELHLPVEAMEKLAIIDSKCGSLVEANHSTANSNDCLGFETNSVSISSVESIHSTVESNCFSTFESKENFSSTTLSFRLLIFPSSSDASTHFHIETPSMYIFYFLIGSRNLGHKQARVHRLCFILHAAGSGKFYRKKG